jgi:hypothetical protein
MDLVYARAIAGQSSFNLRDSDSQFDDISYDSLNRRSSSKSSSKHNRSGNYDADAMLKQQIQDTNKLRAQLDKCIFCFSSSAHEHQHQRQLVVSVGNFFYLSVPAIRRLVPGQCCLTPLQHCPSLVSMDENEYEEYIQFKKRLVQMYASIHQKVVFVHTSFPDKGHHHISVDCVPISPELFDEAPAHFCQSLLQSDEEWSTNVKLITLTSTKGLRKSVPAKFPYFCVEFGDTGDGYAHVIEDRSKFSNTLGLEVLCGLLDDQPAQFVMRQSRQSKHDELKRVTDFGRIWSKFDDWSKSRQRS